MTRGRLTVVAGPQQKTMLASRPCVTLAFAPPEKSKRKHVEKQSKRIRSMISAIIDADLLVKYANGQSRNRDARASDRQCARHIGLREKLREILIDAGRRDQAAQHCLALASLHISAGDVESANARLLEAKRLDPRVSVTGQLRDVHQTKAPPTAARRRF